MIKLFSLLLLPMVLFAEVSTDNQAQGLLNIFNAAQEGWISVIIPVALRLFWLLVIIDWVWSFGMLLLKGTEFSEIMTTLIQKILIIGIFLALFQFTTWMDTIPRTFSIMADSANALATPIEPDTILEQGFSIVEVVWDDIAFFDSVGDSIGLMFAGLIILFAFVLMTAQFFVVIVKIYLLTVGAYIVLALGGLGYTRTIGINPLIAIFKAGIELFFIKLLLGFSLNTIQTMAANVGTDNNSIMAMIGISILIAALVSMVSGLVDALTNGYLGTNGNLAGNTKAAMMGAGAGAVGGSMASVAQVQNSSTNSTIGNSNASDSGNFMNSSKEKVQSVVAGALGGGVGAMSGAIKGAMGFSPLYSGNKSGTAIGKIFSSSNSKEISNSTSMSEQSSTFNKGTSNDDFLSGTIGGEAQNNENSNSDNEEGSSYISGVPRSNNNE